MHIFLYGPPGAGKSTLGGLLAGRLNLPFVDMDRIIEARAGMPIPQIMQARGEAGFRDLESSVLQAIIQDPDGVIALGGGTLLRGENRRLAEINGTVVCLTAELETLQARLAADSVARPLLVGDLRAKLTSLMAGRAEHYNSFPRQVNTSGSPEQLTWQIQIAAGRFHLKAMSPCDVAVQAGGLDGLGEMLAGRGMRNPIVVTDENVAKFHSAPVLDSLRRSSYSPRLLTVPAGESYKTLDTVNLLWKGFLDAGLDRGSTVVALGGGVIGDLAGFAASTFMRGVDWVALPTTLLAMVDASLGGKTGFDLPQGKNLIGSFHPPRLVLADPSTLETLPEAEFRAGLAEVAKHGVISDPGLFELCSQGFEPLKADIDEMVRRAMAVKIRVIEDDPYERGLRAALNVGHTVGHAVELVSGFRLRHGEAVAIGLVAEAKLAERLTVAGKGLAEAIAGPLAGLGLPVRIPDNLPREEILRAMRVDKKKSGGVVCFALPVEIGKVQVGVEVRDLELVFEED